MEPQFINWILGLLTLFIGAYTGSVSARLIRAEAKIEKLQESMLKEYHSKADIQHLLAEIKDSVKGLHAKFEKMESLYGR